MGKRTRGAGLPMLGVLFIAGAAVAQPAINVSTTGSGSPGGTATFSVTLTANGDQVAATQNDITFDPNIPVAAASGSNCAITTAQTCTTDANCPVIAAPFNVCVGGTNVGMTCTADSDCTGSTCTHEPCLTQTGAPECTAQVSGKQGFFSFLPHLCVGGSSAGNVCAEDSDCGTGTCTGSCTPGTNCTGIRAIILAVDNLSAIPDGSTLYTCTVDISPTATVGNTYPLTISNESAGDIHQALISGVTGTNGSIEVATGASFVVCDVEPHTGDEAGQFGSTPFVINIADVKAVFKAAQFGGSFLPAAGSARLSAMDAAPVDNPPTCGGSTPASINIADVKQCFKRAQFSGQTNYTRTLSGSSCTSAVAP